MILRVMIMSWTPLIRDRKAGVGRAGPKNRNAYHQQYGRREQDGAFEVTDIYKTSVCPLARVMRRELKKRGVRTLKVVYSKEAPMTPLDDMSISCRTHCICPPGTARKCTQRRQVPGSNAFVPSVVGLILAGEVVKDLIRADEPAGSGDFRPQPLSTGENA